MDLEMIKPILPQLILIIAALLVPAVGMVRNKLTVWFTLAAVVAAMAATGYLMYDGYSNDFLGMFVFNDFSGLMTFVFLIVLFLVVIMSISGSDTKRRRGEFFSLLMAASVGMIFVAGATNLIVMFVGIELTSISSYALVAFRKNDPRSAEAAVKYLIIGGLSTALSLYGISLMYGLSGTVEIAGVAEYLAAGSYTWPYIVAVITVIAGFGFKIAIVPFHFWAPDVYEGAPTSITTFLAVGSKKMGFIVFFKIFLTMFIIAKWLGGTLPEIQWIFAILAAVTMTVGNLVAISQSNIKRMLAYSSIAQAGYILIVLAVGTAYALEGGIFHMITHVFMKGGAFIVVAALCARGFGENISDYRGLSKRAPLIAFAMLLFLFSLAGIPPLAGFDSKFILFSSAVDGGTWIWLVAVAVINSAISLYYYARVVKAMYIDKGATTDKVRVPLSFAFAIALCAIATVAIGVYPGPILELCERAVYAFF